MDYFQHAVGVELLPLPGLGLVWQMDYCPDVVDAVAHHQLKRRPVLRLEQLAPPKRMGGVGSPR